MTTMSSASATQLALKPLADHLVRLLAEHQRTPVLVSPSFLSLRPEFFAQLALGIQASGIGNLRYDILSPVGGLWQTALNYSAAARLWQLNRRLQSLSSHGISATAALTATIARPISHPRQASHHQNRPANALVVGICNDTVSLPSWTESVPLGGSPADIDRRGDRLGC